MAMGDKNDLEELLGPRGVGQLMASVRDIQHRLGGMERDFKSGIEELNSRIGKHAENNARHIGALEAELERLQTEQEADKDARARGMTLLTFGRWAVGLVLPTVFAGVIWLFAQVQAHETAIARHQDALVQIRDELDRHERLPSHEGSQARMSELGASIASVRATLEEIRDTVRALDSELRGVRHR